MGIQTTPNPLHKSSSHRVSSQSSTERCFCSIVGFTLLVRPVSFRGSRREDEFALYLYSVRSTLLNHCHGELSIGIQKKIHSHLEALGRRCRAVGDWFSNNGARVLHVNIRIMSFAWRMWENVSAFPVWVFVLMGGYYGERKLRSKAIVSVLSEAARGRNGARVDDGSGGCRTLI